MVHQIFADAAQFVGDGNPAGAKHCCGTDARQLQQLGCCERAGGEYDLAPRAGAMLLAAPLIEDCGCLTPVQLDPGGERIGYDVKVPAAARRLQIGGRG